MALPSIARELMLSRVTRFPALVYPCLARAHPQATHRAATQASLQSLQLTRGRGRRLAGRDLPSLGRDPPITGRFRARWKRAGRGGEGKEGREKEWAARMKKRFDSPMRASAETAGPRSTPPPRSIGARGRCSSQTDLPSDTGVGVGECLSIWEVGSGNV
jgi:hypothetical protein